MLTTTLNKIMLKYPMSRWGDPLEWYEKDKTEWSDNDAPVSLVNILESNSLDHALWAIRTLNNRDLNRARILVCDYAESALKFVSGREDLYYTLEMARLCAHGACTKSQLQAAKAVSDGHPISGASGSYAFTAVSFATYAAFGSADDVAINAGHVAYCAYRAAQHSGGDIAAEVEIEIQKQMFIEFCNF